MISWASTDGSVVSQQWTSMSPASIRSSSPAEPVGVEGLVQGVVDRLADQQVVGDLDRPGGVVLAGGGLREHGGHQVVGLHALDRGRVAPPVAEAQDHQRTVEVPPPAGLEHGRVEDGVLEGVDDRSGSDTYRGTSSRGKLW